MATKANITIDQGTTFNTSVSLTDSYGNPLDLSGYTANSQVRKWYTSSTSVNFGVTLDSGNIFLTMNSATTANLTPGRYVYDVLLTDTHNSVTRVVEGIVTVTPRVSK
jgi:hypothetical protein